MTIRVNEENGGKLAAANYKHFVSELNQLVRAAKDVAYSV